MGRKHTFILFIFAYLFFSDTHSMELASSKDELVAAIKKLNINGISELLNKNGDSLSCQDKKDIHETIIKFRSELSDELKKCTQEYKFASVSTLVFALLGAAAYKTKTTKYILAVISALCATDAVVKYAYTKYYKYLDVKSDIVHKDIVKKFPELN